MTDVPSSTAIHEAGHAVVCIAVGGTFRYATMRPRSRTTLGHVYGIRTPCSLADAVVCHAGAVAEHVLLRSVLPKFDLDDMASRGCLSDFVDAMESVGFHEGVTEEAADNIIDLLFGTRDEALDLVENNFKAVLFVAMLLEQRRTLQFAQVRTAVDMLWSEVPEPAA
jgi:hypothetical protein